MDITVGSTTFGAPFSDLLPPLSDDEYETLKADIRERGVVVPVLVDERGNVIDGQHRLRIAAELGITDVPMEIRPGLSDGEKESLAFDLNAHRRQMTREQRQAIAVRLRQRGMSYPQIGKALGVTDVTAMNDVKAAASKFLEAETPDRITGKDGKRYPASKPRVRADNIQETARAFDLLEQVRPPVDRTADVTDLQRIAREQRREQVREQNRQLVEEAPALNTHTEGQRYQTIVLDPPWDWGDEGDVDQFGRARPTYATMSLDEIAALPVGDLAQDNAHIYLWITNRSLPKGFALLERWGFRYVTCLTWCKPNIGMGNYYRGSTEHVLFGVRGSLPLLRSDIGTWFSAPRPGRHSAKPDEFYRLVETCSPGPWLEMFARQERKGWIGWGAEL